MLYIYACIYTLHIYIQKALYKCIDAIQHKVVLCALVEVIMKVHVCACVRAPVCVVPSIPEVWLATDDDILYVVHIHINI